MCTMHIIHRLVDCRCYKSVDRFVRCELVFSRPLFSFIRSKLSRNLFSFCTLFPRRGSFCPFQLIQLLSNNDSFHEIAENVSKNQSSTNCNSMYRGIEQ